MPTPEELRADFKGRFTAVLSDLKNRGQKDPQVIWLIGSLADEIVKRTDRKSWPELRNTLDPAAYNSLLGQFQDQAKAMSEKGNAKAAYAIQAMAVSLISRRFDDAELAEGIRLMDAFIDEAVKFFKQTEASRNTPN